jgi:hypothetical protein
LSLAVVARHPVHLFAQAGQFILQLTALLRGDHDVALEADFTACNLALPVVQASRLRLGNAAKAHTFVSSLSNVELASINAVGVGRLNYPVLVANHPKFLCYPVAGMSGCEEFEWISAG